MKSTITTFMFALFLCFTLNAQDWESIATPVESNLILFDISFSDGQSSIGYAGGSHATWNGKGKILKTIDQGSTWNVIWESEDSGTGITSICFLTPDHGFAGRMNGTVGITNNGGQDWTVIQLDASINVGEVTDLEFYDAENGIAQTIWGGIYVTADGGASWTVATTNYIGGHDAVYADANTLFAVGNGQKIYKSTDKGLNWFEIFDGPGFTTLNLGVHFSDANNGLVTSEEGAIFVTHDGGDTWNNYTVAGQFGLMRGAWVFDENNMYATGTPGQVFKTTNGGMNWTMDSPVDPQPSYYKIKFTSDGTGYVCGSGSTGGTILRKASSNSISVANAELTHLSCFGSADGAIAISIQGGSTPYSFLWSNGDMSQDLNNLPSGTYTCTITDANGTTTISEDYVITEPGLITPNATFAYETVDGADDGSVNLSPTGGTPPLVFSWDNGENTEDIANLPDGTYCVTITDANNCSQTECYDILPGPVGTQEIEDVKVFTVAPNPVTNDEIFVELSFVSKHDIRISLMNAVGQEVYSEKILNAAHFTSRISMTDLPQGLYFVKIESLLENKVISKKVVK